MCIICDKECKNIPLFLKVYGAEYSGGACGCSRESHADAATGSDYVIDNVADEVTGGFAEDDHTIDNFGNTQLLQSSFRRTTIIRRTAREGPINRSSGPCFSRILRLQNAKKAGQQQNRVRIGFLMCSLFFSYGELGVLRQKELGHFQDVRSILEVAYIITDPQFHTPRSALWG